MTSPAEKRNFIKNISILKGLNDEQIGNVISIAGEKHIEPGDILMKEGEGGTSMYLFVKGEVEFTKSSTMKIPKKGFEKAETIGGKLNASFASVLGEMALFEDAPRSATIRALSKCFLYEITREDFDKLCEDDNSLGYIVCKNIIPVLSGRIRSANNDVIKLTTLLSIVLAKKQK